MKKCGPPIVRLLCFSFAIFLLFLTAFILQSVIALRAEASPNASKPPILSASELDYPPFCIVDAEGEPDGFSVELLRAALKAMGREVTFRTGSHAKVRGWLEEGNVRVLPLVAHTPEREHLFDFTFPYMSLHGAIVVRKDEETIRNLEDLRGRRVAVMKGHSAEEFLCRGDRGIEILTANTFQDALHILTEGRCDAIVMQRLVALRLIQEHSLTNLRVIEKPIEKFRQDFCFVVKDGDHDALALLNEGLALVMADGTYRHLHAKWFADLQLPSDRSIIIGGDYNYPPFEYLDDKGRPRGFTVELTRAIARAMDMDIRIHLGPWSDIVRSLEQGDIDVIQGMFYSPDRDLKFDFTQSYLANQYVGIVRKGEGDPPNGTADLIGKRIVVERSDVIYNFLLEQGLSNQVTLVETQEDVLRELAEGKHDCALAVRISSLYLIKKHGWTNLVLGRSPFVTMEYCYAVPNNRKALLAQFSEGLKTVEQSGEYHRIHEKWMGIYTERPIIEFLRYTAMVAIPLLLILLAIFLWSWSLRRKVRMRTKELRESEERYRAFFENSMDAIMLTAPDGRILAANPSACEMFGRTEDEILELGRKGIVAATDPQLTTFLAQRKAQGRARGELTLVRKGGSHFPAEVTSAFFRDSSGATKTSMIVRDMTDRKKAEDDLLKTLERLRKAFAATIQVLVSAVEIRDPYTAGHQVRVAHLARAIAEEMGFDEERMENIRVAGLIHDIGKLSIPAEILSKPTQLTPIEFSLVKEHPRSGYEILKSVETEWPLAEIVCQHHERMDGSGYPRHLKGDEILLEARILAVADVVEAMVSHRPWRPALDIATALNDIENNKGILYDNTIVDTCLRLFREKGYKLPE